MQGSVEESHSPPPRRPERSFGERLGAWALTGPPGRVLSFAADAVAALPMLARYWGGRLLRRGQSSSDA
ncbi:MAG: hypothetical protein FJW90_09005 [Actinobacteria bacterium]|nr:hypothetical protein [Actinomycetota bacterium]